MIGAYPNGQPAAPDIYARRLLEEVLCLEASASRIELATRTLIREMRFIPAISEVLGAIRDAQVVEWGEGPFEIDDGETLIAWARRALEEMVVSAKALQPRLLAREAAR